MHEALRLYDASLEILAQETEALENKDEGRLLELCEKRTEIMEEAWSKRAGCPDELLRERLNALLKGQECVTTRTRMQSEALRLELKNSRQESTRLAGYGKALGNEQNMILLRKEG